jgi:hypothetical protein
MILAMKIVAPAAYQGPERASQGSTGRGMVDGLRGAPGRLGVTFFWGRGTLRMGPYVRADRTFLGFGRMRGCE